jgi:alkanesulfonate monooxygenase SsuD/methylene tetrahydromethanopterin reductase-like flavin-dependent oxidoreductase (luciferase family)
MDVGVGLPNQIRDIDARSLPDWARRGEDLGFSTLGTIGRIAYPGVMDTVALAAAAAVTERVRLLTGILLATTWPPHLLAKETAGIDALSGGRLTLGLGIGGPPRVDDFTVPGLPARGLGKRIDADLAVYQDVWDGKIAPESENPFVPAGGRRVPVLFGGFAQATFDRVARSGDGYVGASVPPEMAGQAFDGVRAAWEAAGRQGKPRLVGIAYSALGDPEAGRANVGHYYAPFGPEALPTFVDQVQTDVTRLRDTAARYRDLGADEFVVNPVVDDLAELDRIADALL